MKDVNNGPKKLANRRSFLKKGMVAAGAGQVLFGQTNSVITSWRRCDSEIPRRSRNH